MSPKAIRDIEGFRFFFFSRENNEPPHIHVERGDGSEKWWLLPEPARVYSVGFKAGEQRRIEKLIHEHKDAILKAWYAHFGQ
jgi:hypothetical protein